MLAVCMTLIDNDKDQTSFEDFYLRNRQIAYAFAYKILNKSKTQIEACAKCFFGVSQNVLKKNSQLFFARYGRISY